MERRRERLRELRELRLTAPPAMVAEATGRRLAGDWRGACAAALVDVRLDLDDIARRYGALPAGRIRAELTGLAPDLMRRFLPRTDGRLTPGATVVLSRFDEPCRAAREGSPRYGPVLVARLPVSWQKVRQACTLEVTHELPGQFHDLPGWAWHADEVADRRWVHGAGPHRLPWHDPDGSAYPQGRVTPPEQAADRTAEVERIAALLSTGRAARAFTEAGFTTRNDPGYRTHGPDLPTLLSRMGRALPVARAELARLTRRYEQSEFVGMDGLVHVEGLTVTRRGTYSFRTGPWVFALPAPAEVSLLRFGDLGPDDLHPLVHDALFPGRTRRDQPRGPHRPEPIRVRCGTGWHTVLATGGRLLTPEHTDAGIHAEFLGGAELSGCAAAVRGWRTGRRPVPRDVRKDRQALFALAFHGDTEGLMLRLAGGVDPALRGPGGGTLLHWLAHLDHRRVLPVLLAAGIPLEERDQDGRTALHAAALSAGEATMAALIAAGADPAPRDQLGHTPAELLRLMRG